MRLWNCKGCWEAVSQSYCILYSVLLGRKQTWQLSWHLLRKRYTPNAVVEWGSPSASDPRAKNTGQRATKGTVLTSQSLSPWCDCRRLGSTLASWRWQDINVGNPLWRRALLLQLRRKRYLAIFFRIDGFHDHQRKTIAYSPCLMAKIFSWMTFWQNRHSMSTCRRDITIIALCQVFDRWCPCLQSRNSVSICNMRSYWLRSRSTQIRTAH